jgi:hypothetical protein
VVDGCGTASYRRNPWLLLRPDTVREHAQRVTVGELGDVFSSTELVELVHGADESAN